MADNVILKYFFQNSTDKGLNYMFVDQRKKKLSTIRDVVKILEFYRIVDQNCHLRFKDCMNEVICWVDVRNDRGPLPINKHGEIEIKILKIPPSNDKEPQRIANDKPDGEKEELKPVIRMKSQTPDKLEGSKVKREMSDNPLHDHSKGINLHNIKSQYTNVKSNDIDDIQQDREPIPKPTNAKSNGFDEFMFEDFDREHKDRSKSREPQPKQDNDFFDLLNIELKDNPRGYKGNDPDQQKDKMDAGQFIEPKVRQWAYKNNVRKDIRTLLTTVHTVLWEDQRIWVPLTLSDILTDEALRRASKKALLSLHPDKNNETIPSRLYVLERITSEINHSFEEYRKTKK